MFMFVQKQTQAESLCKQPKFYMWGPILMNFCFQSKQPLPVSRPRGRCESRLSPQRIPSLSLPSCLLPKAQCLSKGPSCWSDGQARADGRRRDHGAEPRTFPQQTCLAWHLRRLPERPSTERTRTWPASGHGRGWGVPASVSSDMMGSTCSSPEAGILGKEELNVQRIWSCLHGTELLHGA